MSTINWERSFFPAVPIPFLENGEIHEEAMEKYAAYMNTQDISGVSLWVHTGRGLLISDMQREQVYKCWREKLDDSKKIICGVGAEYKEGNSEEEYLNNLLGIGNQAKDLGADAILVYPPTIYRDSDERQDKIVEYHKKVAVLGLPMVLFYLYKEAGGILYSLETLSRLFDINMVEAIKMATLDSVCTYQDVSNMVKKNFPQINLITGEDRMFGYTMTRGAVGALVGLGAAGPAMQKEMIDAYFNKNYDQFTKLMYDVDKFAESIFIQPMEGYIERLLYLLFLQGIIPEEAVNDPYGPGISKEEKKKIKETALNLGLLRGV